MKDVGTEFTDFLKAYGLEDYYKLASPSIKDSEIDVIFARHQSNFDAWRKVPIEFRDVYGRIPPYMLDKAKTDPNFTEGDAQRAKEEHDKTINPYSPIDKSLEENPIYQDMLLCGIIITPAHIAAMKLAADELRNAGYSNRAAESISQGDVLCKILFSQREQILNDPNLSEQERAEKLKHTDQNIDTLRLDKDQTKKEDNLINRPERILIHTLRDIQRGAILRTDGLLLADLCVAQILETNRLSLLKEEMNKSLYAKVLKDEQKQLLEKILDTHGITMQGRPQEKPQEKLNPKPEPAKDAPYTPLEVELIAMKNRIYGGRG